MHTTSRVYAGVVILLTVQHLGISQQVCRESGNTDVLMNTMHLRLMLCETSHVNKSELPQLPAHPCIATPSVWQPASASRVLHERYQCQLYVGRSCGKTQVHCADDTWRMHCLQPHLCLLKLAKCCHPSPGVLRQLLFDGLHEVSQVQ